MPQRLTAPGDEEIRQGRATTLPNPLSIYLAFMFLIELRENPEKAKQKMRNGFKIR